MSMKPKILFRTVFLCLLSAFSAFAQAISDENVSGVVRDITGRGIPEADVRLVSPQNIVLRSTQTGAAGTFEFRGVPEGSYVLLVSRAGYISRSQALKVVPGHSGTSALEVQLGVSIPEERVTVTADTGVAVEKEKASQPLNIISADALTQRTTAVIAQAADEETGISLQRTSPTIGAVLVRGLTEVGVYVDGIRYTNSTQRGGINTFFNLNEATAVRSIEVQRSPNTAQFGSDGLGGSLHLNSRQPEMGFADPNWNGEFAAGYTSADRSFGGNTLVGYGTERFGILTNFAARRINTLRPGGGIDSHSAITRFLGLPSNIIGSGRLPDTAFTQYSGTVHANFAPSAGQYFSFRYQRSQQDGGKRYDQLLGGDGNLIAELKNLMLDFGYLRYFRQNVGPFDTLSAAVSYNSQREERINQGGQGNPLASITNDKERTASLGFNFYLDKQLGRNHVLIGGDHYHDKVDARSFNTDPATGTVRLVRPRVPNGAGYDLTGIYVQDVLDAIPGRLRLSGALRYNVAFYRSRAADAPVVNGRPLFPDDSARFGDWSGRVGATVKIHRGFGTAFNYSRGFRAPNITSLGSLGLVGVGFQVSTTDVAGLGATIGSTADAAAISTGVDVGPLKSEISNSYDLSLRYNGRRLSANLTGFFIDYRDAIVRQTLILPPGAVGRQLGSQTIVSQNANGAVFVSLSTAPVLVQTNFNNTRISGAEFEFDYRFTANWHARGNYSYVYAEDRATGEPPNLGGGGLPPQFAFLSIRYAPARKRFWIEGYVNGAGRQSRLSSLDLADRRTGGARTRGQIQNFFRRGACVYGITSPGSSGQCGSSGGILIATGETLAEVQARMLPGISPADNNTAVPLFRSIPGYVLFNVRGGYRISEKIELTADLENIGDKSHRAPGWGIDGQGRSVSIRMRYNF